MNLRQIAERVFAHVPFVTIPVDAEPLPVEERLFLGWTALGMLAEAQHDNLSADDVLTVARAWAENEDEAEAMAVFFVRHLASS